MVSISRVSMKVLQLVFGKHSLKLTYGKCLEWPLFLFFLNLVYSAGYWVNYDN